MLLFDRSFQNLVKFYNILTNSTSIIMSFLVKSCTKKPCFSPDAAFTGDTGLFTLIQFDSYFVLSQQNSRHSLLIYGCAKACRMDFLIGFLVPMGCGGFKSTGDFVSFIIYKACNIQLREKIVLLSGVDRVS